MSATTHPATCDTSLPGRRILRFPGPLFAVLRDHLGADPDREQFAFVLARPHALANGVLLLGQEVCLPDADDLEVQSSTRVTPRAGFQARIYDFAVQGGLVLIDAHTHVTTAAPTLSDTDRRAAAANAEYITTQLPAPCTLGLIVFNRNLSAHDALFYDRGGRAFQPLTELQVVGPGLACYPTGVPPALPEDARQARQRLVPGWRQAALARPTVGIAGAGGHGAQLLQTLVSLGAGATGGIVCVDPDVVEVSNLPRLPYATAKDVGRLKVAVAADYVRRTQPGTPFVACTCAVAAPAARQQLAGCDVLFGCGDNDGVRLVLNDLAVRHGIPLIDLGADIRSSADKVEAGGQVRVVVPGATACLACSGAIDVAQAALDVLDPDARALYAQRGYVLDGDGGPTPSVALLNSLVAQFAATAFLALAGSGPLARWDYAHIDWRTGQSTIAHTTRRLDCPVCGAGGCLFQGSAEVLPLAGAEPAWQPVSAASGGAC